jgi:hypothetical protein
MPLEPIYKLRDWISIDQLDWVLMAQNPNAIQLFQSTGILENLMNCVYYSTNYEITPSFRNAMKQMFFVHLSKNPNAMHIIERYLKEPFGEENKFIGYETFKIYMSQNRNAVPLLEKYPQLIDWYHLSTNPSAIHLLEANPDKINWQMLSQNSAAMHLLEANPEKINWHFLSLNPAAIKLLERNRDKIDWKELSLNPNAIHMLEQNQHMIDWYMLCMNPNAIPLLEKNRDKLQIPYNLCVNPNAMDLLHDNMNLICWREISKNPGIFVYDYPAMRESYKTLKEELIRTAWHPKRVVRLLEMGMDVDDM